MSVTATSDRSPPRFQFRLSTLLVAMVGLGIACAALATPTKFWAGVVFSMATVSLPLSVLFIIHRRGATRAFAIGYLIFAGSFWGAWLLEDNVSNGPLADYKLPTTRLSGRIYMQSHAKRTRQVAATPGMGTGGASGLPRSPTGLFIVPRYFFEPFAAAFHAVLTVLLGLAGGIVSRFLFLTRPDNNERRAAPPVPYGA
jgi:hypothetical protein